MNSLVRWDPFRELEEMTRRLDRFLGRQEERGTNGKEMMTVADWAPPVDISENEAELEIKAELPGVEKENVKVTVESGMLTLQGEREQEREENGRKIHRIERSYGHFLRCFALPAFVDETKVMAEFKDGILHLRLPKSEKAKSKALEVKVT